ncbi:hypothetical protein MAC_08442 [Metarhizium acridum CQMa 102]|uniref:3CxxC-type domain-containing protein n=1 Tax=Metarhizium acridum (strain CQMa 102) TaxID=655827 RepID=E9EEZ4_METAQ|nr:uncharacterized protein MAC_08442 [Metarhizium acridum CQMa 102]EFY85495.1 hypothetical protein MAC_08442 [Metarhizium acridum CQMa 102]
MPLRTKGWSMFPEHHRAVADLLKKEKLHFTFQHADEETGHIKDRDTNVMGRFDCPNTKCTQKGWSSKKIAVWVRLYPGSRYNARVYNQRCKSCNSLGRPTLDDSYAERIAYRLKRWSDIKLEPPPYSGGNGKPHERDLCEGCKNGHCADGELEERMESFHF